MAIFQVSHEQGSFVVLRDGFKVHGSERPTRGAAIKLAIELKENS